MARLANATIISLAVYANPEGAICGLFGWYLGGFIFLGGLLAAYKLRIIK